MKQKYLKIPSYFSPSKFQMVPKHKLSYLDFGKIDNPNIVFCVHGLTRNAHDFEQLGYFLSKKYRVISVDIAGRGSSEWLNHHKYYNFDTYFYDIIYIFKKLKFSKVHYVGSSMGGILGMALATYKPSLIKTLVMNDIGPEIPKRIVEKVRKYVPINPEFDHYHDAKEHVQKILKHFGIREERDWEQVVQHSIKLDKDSKYRLNYDPKIVGSNEGNSLLNKMIKNTQIFGNYFSKKKRDVNMIDLWYLWKNITCPILVLHGLSSDILLTSTVDKMKANHKAEILEVESGHMPALIYPRELEYMYNWLNKNIR